MLDSQTIHQIAEEVVAQIPLGSPYWYMAYLVASVILTALAAGFAAWGGSFLKAKGQNLATRQDFDDLLKQQKATAQSVETIKSEFSQRDWAQREWTTLRRIKLEALVDKIHEIDASLDRHGIAAISGETSQAERDLVGELSSISAIYFSAELGNETHAFGMLCRQERQELYKYAKAIIATKHQTESVPKPASVSAHRRERLHAQQVLMAAACSLVKQIMNVSEKKPM